VSAGIRKQSVEHAFELFGIIGLENYGDYRYGRVCFFCLNLNPPVGREPGTANFTWPSPRILLVREIVNVYRLVTLTHSLFGFDTAAIFEIPLAPVVRRPRMFLGALGFRTKPELLAAFVQLQAV